MPKVWSDTIEEHRREVRDAILESTATLVAEHGLASVTMSQIAETTGIGRATLYKYFAGVEEILTAWHERKVAEHLTVFAKIKDQPGRPSARLEAVLEAFALMSHEHKDHKLAALVHRGEHVSHAQRHLHGFLRDLLAEAARAGELRNDPSPDELATYCLHAVSAAGGLSSKAAVRRLVGVILTGLKSRA